MAQVKIIFPTALTNVTNGEKETKVFASNFKGVLHELITRYGDKFKDRIFDSSGSLRRFLNFYVNGKNVLHLEGIETQLQDGDEISILPAVAGG